MSIEEIELPSGTKIPLKFYGVTIVLVRDEEPEMRNVTPRKKLIGDGNGK